MSINIGTKVIELVELWTFSIDVHVNSGVIILTYRRPLLGVHRANKESQPSLEEDRCTSRRGDPELHTREGPGFEIQGRRILRPARHRSGEVRNVASRFGGERIRDEHCGRVWCLKADVLSGEGRVRQSRNRGARTQEAWSSRSSQTSSQRAFVSRKASHSGRADPSASAGDGRSEEIRSRDPSKDDRTSARWKKNFAMRPSVSEQIRPESHALKAQYETLRMAALGSPLPFEARSGLALFLRRGMWGWARVIAKPSTSAPQHSACSPPKTSTTRDEHRAVIRVFAAMAMNTNSRRREQ